MLGLKIKTAEEVERLWQDLSSKFDRDYKTLKAVSIPITKGAPSPAHVVRYTSAVAEAREYSDTASRIEARWLRVYQEARVEADYRGKVFRTSEHEAMLADSSLKALKSLEERRAAVAPKLLQESRDLLVFERLRDESKGWWEYAKTRHSHIRNAQKDVLTAIAILRIAVDTKQFNVTPAVAGSLEDHIIPEPVKDPSKDFLSSINSDSEEGEEPGDEDIAKF